MEIGSRVLQECVTIVHFFLSTLSIVQWMGKYDLLYVNTVGNGHVWLKVSQMVNLTFLIVVVFFSFLIDSLGFFCFILYGILWYGFGWVTKNQKETVFVLTVLDIWVGFWHVEDLQKWNNNNNNRVNENRHQVKSTRKKNNTDSLEAR